MQVFEFEVPAGAERFVVAGDVLEAGQVLFRVDGDFSGSSDVVAPFAGEVAELAPLRFVLVSRGVFVASVIDHEAADAFAVAFDSLAAGEAFQAAVQSKVRELGLEGVLTATSVSELKPIRVAQVAEAVSGFFYEGAD